MTGTPSEPLRPSPLRDTTSSRLRERYLENREKDASAPWTEWLRERYARYWYGIGCLFLVVVIAGVVLQAGPSPTQAWQYFTAVALIGALTYLEFRGYRWLWPPEPDED